MTHEDLIIQAIMRAYHAEKNRTKSPDPDLVSALIAEMSVALQDYGERQTRRIERMQSALRTIAATTKQVAL